MKIMVPVDSSPYAKRGVEIAGQYAEKSQAEIYLVNVQPVFDSAKSLVTKFVPVEADQELTKKAAAEATAILDEAEGILSAYKTGKVTKQMLSGHIAEEIVNYAESEKIDLIIIGSRGLSGIKRFLIGSVTATVVAHAHSSVLVVKSAKG
jgi:nucleotide-binding universal stress UspA family protein